MQLNRNYVRTYGIYAWAVLAYHVAVILWGAVVRATGAGAGCGEHWPLCNGVALPRSPTLATVIEFTHRLTSGVAGLLCLGLIVFAFLVFPKGHLSRRAALAALFFELMEGVLGAALVLAGKVAKDQSLSRGYLLSVHLINTLLLVAAFTIAAWAGSRGALTWRRRIRGLRIAFAAATAGLLILAVSGAIAALGDTLFRSTTLAGGFQQDFATGAHPFLRLRVWHPVIAVAVTAGLAALCVWAARQRIAGVQRSAFAVMVLIVAQLGVGTVNLTLLAPVALQIVHLLLADALWIAFILLTANALLTADAPDATPRASASELASIRQ